eukprot:12318714-Alexandrium_andersonii.AAC.3
MCLHAVHDGVWQRASCCARAATGGAEDHNGVCADPHTACHNMHVPNRQDASWHDTSTLLHCPS